MPASNCSGSAAFNLLTEKNKRSQPTVHILVKAEELHQCVLRQLLGVWVSHIGVTGAGEHVAPVLPPGADAVFPYLQEQAFLDAV